MAGTRNIV